MPTNVYQKFSLISFLFLSFRLRVSAAKQLEFQCWTEGSCRTYEERIVRTEEETVKLRLLTEQGCEQLGKIQRFARMLKYVMRQLLSPGKSCGMTLTRTRHLAGVTRRVRPLVYQILELYFPVEIHSPVFAILH